MFFLSVAFFFKATDTSNKFYDNVYKFTKEVSEILGRIEAGFGERLRHIDEGYTGLRDKFENLPFDLPTAKKKEEEEKKEVQEKEAELKEIISSVMERAQLAEDEKLKLLHRLESAQEELEFSKRELRHLQRNINVAESSLENIPSAFVEELTHYISNRIPSKYYRASPTMLRRKFFDLIVEARLPEDILRYMINRNLLSESKELTDDGIRILRRSLRLLYNKEN